MPQPNPRAGVRRRIAGMLYESMLLLGVLSVTYIVPHLVYSMVTQRVAPGWFQWLHIFLVLGAYFIWYWRHGGQTLAMQTWKMQLVRFDDGTPATQQLLLRYVVAWPSLFFFGVGLFWALFDRDRQFLHDRLAGTRIIFKQPATQP